MMVFGGRSSKKTIHALCEAAARLESEIELHKRVGLPYKDLDRQLVDIYKKLDKIGVENDG